jgi:hypothetical protein
MLGLSPPRILQLLDSIAGLDLAIDTLYPHTEFDKMGRKFYHRTLDGTLKPNQEEILRKLGVKI